MKRRLLVLIMALTLCRGLVPTALAYETPDFTDVPSGSWAYKDVMEMADAGIIKGTGDRQFSPESKVSAAMLLTLVGRVVFPELTDGPGSDWAKPYVTAAQEAGWLEGTNIDPNNSGAEVTRYDMAVILAKAAKKLGITQKAVDTSAIKDYGEIPNKYTSAVDQVYGNGLINGSDGKFNGNSTMRRNEAAAVMSRLIALKPTGGNFGVGVTGQETDESTQESMYAWANEYAPIVTYDPSSVEIVQGNRPKIDMGFLAKESIFGIAYLHVGDQLQLAICEVPEGYGYTKDNLKEQLQYWLGQIKDLPPNKYVLDRLANGMWISDNPDVATVDENGLVTALKQGEAQITVEIPVIYHKDVWETSWSSVIIYVDP